MLLKEWENGIVRDDLHCEYNKRDLGCSLWLLKAKLCGQIFQDNWMKS